MSDPKNKKDKKDKKKDKDKKKNGEGETTEEGSESSEAGAEGDAEQLDLDGDSKKKGIKPIILIGGAVVLLIAAGAGVYFSGLLDPLLGKTETEEHAAEGEEGAKEKDGHGEKKTEKKKDGGHGKKKESGGHGGGHGSGGEEGAGGAEGFMALPDLIVNLSSNQGPQRYLKLKVQLELVDPADQAAVEAVAPRVIDHFQTYLRELRVSDLRGSAGIYRLRQELLARVNAAAAPVEVKDVLFQEILIQ